MVDTAVQQQRQQFSTTISQTQEALRQRVPSQEQLRTTGIQSLPARQQAQEQARQIKQYQAEVQASQGQFETEVAKYSPEEALPELREQAYQEVTRSIAPKVEVLKQRVEILRNKIATEQDGTRQNELEGNLREAEAELGVYEGALQGDPEELIKGYYSGEVQAAAEYGAMKEQAYNQGQQLEQQQQQAWEKAGGRNVNLTFSEGVIADAPMIDVPGYGLMPMYQPKNVMLTGGVTPGKEISLQEYRSSYAPYKYSLQEWGKQTGLTNLPSFAKDVLIPTGLGGISGSQQLAQTQEQLAKAGYQLQSKGLDLSVVEKATGKTYSIDEYNKMAGGVQPSNVFYGDYTPVTKIPGYGYIAPGEDGKIIAMPFSKELTMSYPYQQRGTMFTSSTGMYAPTTTIRYEPSDIPKLAPSVIQGVKGISLAVATGVKRIPGDVVSYGKYAKIAYGEALPIFLKEDVPKIAVKYFTGIDLPRGYTGETLLRAKEVIAKAQPYEAGALRIAKGSLTAAALLSGFGVAGSVLGASVAGGVLKGSLGYMETSRTWLDEKYIPTPQERNLALLKAGAGGLAFGIAGRGVGKLIPEKLGKGLGAVWISSLGESAGRTAGYYRAGQKDLAKLELGVTAVGTAAFLLPGAVPFLKAKRIERVLRRPGRLDVDTEIIPGRTMKFRNIAKEYKIINEMGKEVPGGITKAGTLEIRRGISLGTESKITGKNWVETLYAREGGEFAGKIVRKGLFKDYTILYKGPVARQSIGQTRVNPKQYLDYLVKTGKVNYKEVPRSVIELYGGKDSRGVFQDTPKGPAILVQSQKDMMKELEPFSVALKKLGETPQSYSEKIYQKMIVHELSHMTQPKWFRKIDNKLPYNLKLGEIFANVKSKFIKSYKIPVAGENVAYKVFYGDKLLKAFESPQKASEFGLAEALTKGRLKVAQNKAIGDTRIILTREGKVQTMKLVKVGEGEYNLRSPRRLTLRLERGQVDVLTPAERKDILSFRRVEPKKLSVDLVSKTTKKAIISKTSPPDYLVLGQKGAEIRRGATTLEPVVSAKAITYTTLKTPRFKTTQIGELSGSLSYTLYNPKEPTIRARWENRWGDFVDRFKNKKAQLRLVPELSQQVQIPREEVFASELISPRIRIIESPKVSTELRLFPILGQAQQRVQVQQTWNRLDQINVREIQQIQPTQEIVQRTRQAQMQVFSPIQAFQQVQIPRQQVLPKARTIVKTPRIEIPRRDIPKIRIQFGADSSARRTTARMTKMKKGSYVTELRRRGKFQAIGKAPTPARAVELGVKAARGTLGASFRVKGPKGYLPLKPTQEFRLGGGKVQQPTILVQRAPRRLETFGERREIKLSRRKLKLF